MSAASATVLPFSFLGNASGHDFEFHMYSWMEVVDQWKHGIVYPRWAALAHWGYGEPRFMFYPPASWSLGAMLGVILPWRMAPGAYIWLALTLAGISMFQLARQNLSRADAAFAAALYAVNPYFLVIVYWRSAFAELLAGALLPLLLLFVLRIGDGDQSSWRPLTLVVAAAWLTNAPGAVMVMYSGALLTIIVAVVQRSVRPVIFCGMAALLGLGLAAYYVLPAAYEERWVEIVQALAPGLQTRDNFFLTWTSDPDHNRFNLLVSLIGTAEIVIVVFAAWLSRHGRMTKPALWWMLASWAALASVLLFSPTQVLWDHLPELRFLQLPWRWLLCLSVPFSLLVTFGIRRWTGRIALYVVMLMVMFVGWTRVQGPWWDSADDIKEMTDAVEDRIGYEGTEEYVPMGVDPYDIKQHGPAVAFMSNPEPAVHVNRWDAELKDFTLDAPQPTAAILRLFNYRAWAAKVNGAVVPIMARPGTGQIVVPLARGKSHVQVIFKRTWDRALGALVSVLTAALVLVLYATQRRRGARFA